MTITFGSVCSGIEAASAAWLPLGWKCSFMSEIEAFPRAVLAHHYPETPLHGDFTTIAADRYEPIDLLVGGTPCQSFSVAGLRGGLDDDRGNLALEYLRLADRLRPRWLVWENVPGVLSSNGGRDFGAILGGMVELGYGVAYRVLDAQFFGVAQRRRRVFVVGYAGDWRRAAAVLFERHSLSGHPAPRREAGKRVARPIAAGSARGSGYRNDADTADNLIAAFGGNDTRGPIDVATACNAHGGPMGRLDFESETFVAAIAPALSSSNPYGDHESREGLLVAHAFDARQSDVIQYGDFTGAPDTDGQTMAICFSSKDHGADATLDLSPTLRAGTHSASHANAGAPPAVAYGIRSDASRAGEAKTPSADAHGRVRLRNPGMGVYEEIAPTVDASQPHAVAFALRGREGGAMPEIGGDHVGSLRAASGGSSRDYVAFDTTQITSVANRCNPQAGDPCHPLAAGAHPPTIAGTVRSHTRPSSNEVGSIVATSAVRRLTPRECERLQGFPDDFTMIPWRKGLAPDGPRYKALGNSMAVPVMAHIGRRIQQVEELCASLEKSDAA